MLLVDCERNVQSITQSDFVTMALKLYGHPVSLCTRRVLTVLAEKDVKFEFVHVDFLSGEQKKPPYNEVMPFGQIPLLEDGPLRIYESRAIARYLAFKYQDSGTPLVPASNDLQACALFEQFASVEYSQFYDVALKLLMLKVFNRTPSDKAAIELSVKELHSKLDVIDGILSRQQYMGGRQFRIIDAFYLPVVDTLINAAGEGPAFTERKNLDEWWKRVSGRDSWRKVVEGKVGK